MKTKKELPPLQFKFDVFDPVWFTDPDSGQTYKGEIVGRYPSTLTNEPCYQVRLFIRPHKYGNSGKRVDWVGESQLKPRQEE